MTQGEGPRGGANPPPSLPRRFAIGRLRDRVGTGSVRTGAEPSGPGEDQPRLSRSAETGTEEEAGGLGKRRRAISCLSRDRLSGRDRKRPGDRQQTAERQTDRDRGTMRKRQNDSERARERGRGTDWETDRGARVLPALAPRLPTHPQARPPPLPCRSCPAVLSRRTAVLP